MMHEATIVTVLLMMREFMTDEALAFTTGPGGLVDSKVALCFSPPSDSSS